MDVAVGGRGVPVGLGVDEGKTAGRVEPAALVEQAARKKAQSRNRWKRFGVDIAPIIPVN